MKSYHGCPICKAKGYLAYKLKCFCCDGLGIITYHGESRLWIYFSLFGMVIWNKFTKNYNLKQVRMVSDVLKETDKAIRV